MDDDYALALQLQSELFQGDNSSNCNHSITNEPRSLVDPYWEVTDPNPDVRALFLQFNDRFFWGKLAGVEVRWSPRMTLCAGLCCYEGRGGLCSVRLSVPLLKLRPRKDLIETLLHEMIHAYLFITDNNKDHDGHGPEFHKHMYRINKETGTNISVYHNFHDEVDSYKQHWWRCNGPCQNHKPYFGYVKRSMNRAPSKNDTWWARHQQSCGGTYTKIKEPENYGKKKKNKEKDGEDSKKKEKVSEKSSGKNMDIRVFGGEGKTLGNVTKSNTTPKFSNSIPIPSTGNSVNKPLNSHRPKPSATVSRLEDASCDYKKGDKNKRGQSVNGHVTVLPGAITPNKQGASINKPVSQGGVAKFNDKKKVIDVPDFSDSDDDDEFLCSIPITDLSNTSMHLNETDSNGTMQGSHNSSRDCDNSDSITSNDRDNRVKVNELESEIDSDITKLHHEQNSGRDSEADDVRAMLRKVWGQKQFGNPTSKMKVKGTFKSEIPFMNTSKTSNSSSNNVSGTHKRTSGDLGFDEIMSKRHKNNSIYTPGTNNSDINKDSEREKNSPKKLVTSPIDKFFKKSVSGSPRTSSKNDSHELPGLSSDSSMTRGDTSVTMTRGDNSVTNNNRTESTSEMSQCPVCIKSVSAASINDHLDLCLTMQAI